MKKILQILAEVEDDDRYEYKESGWEINLEKNSIHGTGYWKNSKSLECGRKYNTTNHLCCQSVCN